jgi:hypothetical protein
MPTAIDGMPTRRDFLFGMAALIGAPAVVRATELSGEAVRLAAAWQAGEGYRVGLLDMTTHGRVSISAALDVPTRAHGLLREPSGSVLSVARRPGDWLVRWDEQGRALTWRWIEPGRAFAGHMLASANGATVYTTEIDLETGAGLIGVRDGATLAKRDEWSSHGIDPHQLLWDATRPGAFIVANGGVPTRPETGRIKHDLNRMDSSLVRLDGASGRRLGQWRLSDPRLSLRHLAWNGACLGVALQAEHDNPADKLSAPVLAILENEALRTVAGPSLDGYGGSIAAHGDGFAVSCPRTQGVALYDVQGYHDFVALAEACPLADTHGCLWAGGRTHSLGLGAAPALASLPDIRLDNHWIAL